LKMMQKQIQVENLLILKALTVIYRTSGVVEFASHEKNRKFSRLQSGDLNFEINRLGFFFFNYNFGDLDLRLFIFNSLLNIRHEFVDIQNCFSVDFEEFFLH